MTDIESTATSTFGVLDHTTYASRFLPIVERLRGGEGSAIDDLRTFVAAIDDGAQRDEAAAQLERLEGAVGNGRWHRNAAGQILEMCCVDQIVRLPDMLPTFQTAIEFLYAWNDENAETIHRFFAFLGDRTIPWASPSDAWRALLPASEIVEVGEAMADLTARDLKKLLVEAEDGDVFSPDEARDVSEWWGELRKVVRVANRLEHGLYVSVRHPV